MPRRAFKVAQIGAGRMGAIHGRDAAANPRIDLAYLIETRSDAAKTLATELGCGTATFAEALADVDLAGVIVASATDTHLDFTLACLAAGKAVFCEKPLDLDLARLRAEAAVFQGAASPLYVGFNRRFDPHFQALKAKIASGAIGTLETLSIVNHDPAPPPPDFIPASGGLFRDFTIHDFDTARWLMDEEPVSVFALAECLVDPAIGEAGDVDTARLVLRTASGRLCAISNTRRSGYGYDQRAEAFCSRGMAMADNPRVTTLETWSEAGALAAPIHDGFAARYAEAFRREMDHFAAILAGEADPLTGYEASVRALALAEAAGRSLQTGAPVAIGDV
jgi:myo-inositol 2-dehydrogenase / D-chiro-inositol 1-dehydrogenase